MTVLGRILVGVIWMNYCNCEFRQIPNIFSSFAARFPVSFGPSIKIRDHTTTPPSYRNKDHDNGNQNYSTKNSFLPSVPINLSTQNDWRPVYYETSSKKPYINTPGSTPNHNLFNPRYKGSNGYNFEPPPMSVNVIETPAFPSLSKVLSARTLQFNDPTASDLVPPLNTNSWKIDSGDSNGWGSPKYEDVFSNNRKTTSNQRIQRQVDNKKHQMTLKQIVDLLKSGKISPKIISSGATKPPTNPRIISHNRGSPSGIDHLGNIHKIIKHSRNELAKSNQSPQLRSLIKQDNRAGQFRPSIIVNHPTMKNKLSNGVQSQIFLPVSSRDVTNGNLVKDIKNTIEKFPQHKSYLKAVYQPDFPLPLLNDKGNNRFTLPHMNYNAKKTKSSTISQKKTVTPTKKNDHKPSPTVARQVYQNPNEKIVINPIPYVIDRLPFQFKNDGDQMFFNQLQLLPAMEKSTPSSRKPRLSNIDFPNDPVLQNNVDNQFPQNEPFISSIQMFDIRPPSIMSLMDENKFSTSSSVDNKKKFLPTLPPIDNSFRSFLPTVQPDKNNRISFTDAKEKGFSKTIYLPTPFPFVLENMISDSITKNELDSNQEFFSNVVLPRVSSTTAPPITTWKSSIHNAFKVKSRGHHDLIKPPFFPSKGNNDDNDNISDLNILAAFTPTPDSSNNNKINRTQKNKNEKNQRSRIIQRQAIDESDLLSRLSRVNLLDFLKFEEQKQTRKQNSFRQTTLLNNRFPTTTASSFGNLFRNPISATTAFPFSRLRPRPTFASTTIRPFGRNRNFLSQPFFSTTRRPFTTTRQPFLPTTRRPFLPTTLRPISQFDDNSQVDRFENLIDTDQYEFSYIVRAPTNNLHYGRAEARNGPVTVGEYFVLLPDNRIQHVTYISDEQGHRSDVQYYDNGGNVRVNRQADFDNSTEPVLSEFHQYLKKVDEKIRHNANNLIKDHEENPINEIKIKPLVKNKTRKRQIDNRDYLDQKIVTRRNYSRLKRPKNITTKSLKISRNLKRISTTKAPVTNKNKIVNGHAKPKNKKYKSVNN